MRRLIFAALFVSVGCKKAPSYEPYRDAGAGYSLEAPKDWPRDADPAPAGKPSVTTEFIGDIEPQDQGIALGAVLTVTRLSRKAGEKMLAPTKALFPDDAATPAESKPYSRDYEHGGPTPMHQNAAPIPMRVEGRVFRTADAFFVVEMRAVRGKFEKNRHALERALATFRPG
jgi:hypothetical protein